MDIENAIFRDKFLYGKDGNRFRVDYSSSGSRTLSKVYVGNCEFGYDASNTQIYKRTKIYAHTGVCAVYRDTLKNGASLKEFKYIDVDFPC